MAEHHDPKKALGAGAATPADRSERRPTVVLALSGSIAAFKAVEVARHLLKAGVRVLPVMTAAARHFVGPATLSGLCSHPVHSDMFGPDAAGEIHVELTEQADVVALVPATADLLASMAQGRADDVVRAVALCAQGPVVVAPAMHPRMWHHPATERNVAILRADDRVHMVGPVRGEVATGEVGMGRMAEPEIIAQAVLALLQPPDLSELRVVVSAGPTVEDLDPARFVSNRSSGKMGFAVAARAAARGAAVTLIAGPVSLPTPPGVHREDVRSAVDMQGALRRAMGAKLERADALVMTAAVADYRAGEIRTSKMKRAELGATWQVELIKNPDLLAEIGARRDSTSPALVGFALETVTGDELVTRARGKLDAKGVDLVVANHADDGFDGDDNRVTLVTRDDATPLERMPKSRVADRILDWVAARCRP